MNLKRYVSKAAGIAPAACLLIGLGCGSANRTPPSAADPDQARTALQTALDAWKNRETPVSLKDRTPPIRVADEDWLAGLRLEKFEPGAATKVVGTSLDCPVVLTLKDDRGKTRRKNVVYEVGTDPSLTIIRKETP